MTETRHAHPPTPASESPAEVDYRFTLANERTFLAWIRTALGLLAGGVAAYRLLPRHPTGVRGLLALTCVAFTAMVTVGAYAHWRQVGRRMARGQPLPGTPMVPLLTAVTALVAVIAAAVLYR